LISLDLEKIIQEFFQMISFFKILDSYLHDEKRIIDEGPVEASS
jgi:hypothetical protein